MRAWICPDGAVFSINQELTAASYCIEVGLAADTTHARNSIRVEILSNEDRFALVDNRFGSLVFRKLPVLSV